MRILVLATGIALALPSPGLAVEVDNFALRTTRDLVALCSSREEDPLYAEALQFCFGYVAGVAQLHRALVRAGDLKPLACPRYEVTREALARIFLDWAHADPRAADSLPAESVKRAAAAAWPCAD